LWRWKKKAFEELNVVIVVVLVAEFVTFNVPVVTKTRVKEVVELEGENKQESNSIDVPDEERR
jgi:hypothetical protein